MRTHWTRKEVLSSGGYGDKILATTNDPALSWYWREVNDTRGVFNFQFKPNPGRVVYNQALGAIADVADAIIIEPHVKQTFSADNRDWGFARWQAVVDALPLRFVQCLHHGLPVLANVDVLTTTSFEHAVAVLAAARGLVSGVGGLIHAAAALGKPAVVVWGAFAPPEVLGYESHTNIAEPDADALGWRTSFFGCRAAMQRISVERVTQAVRETFR